MSDHTPSLSPRHERFVAEYLRDGNATQAYIRAGYATRGAQPSASRLLRDPRIEAAITAGRQRIDLQKANQAQRAGIVELRVSNHSKQEQRAIPKLGKLQALAALTPGSRAAMLARGPRGVALTAERIADAQAFRQHHSVLHVLGP